MHKPPFYILFKSINQYILSYVEDEVGDGLTLSLKQREVAACLTKESAMACSKLFDIIEYMDWS